MRNIRPARAFWGVIIALALITLLLVAVGWWRTEDPQHGAVSIDRDALRALFEDALDQAVVGVRDEVLEPALDVVFAPVLAAIPAYADFHYSVLGEYAELIGSALGQAAAELESRLFAGFAGRLDTATARLDAELLARYSGAMAAGLGDTGTHAAPLIAMVQDDARARLAKTAPIGVLAAGATSGLGKVIAGKIATKIATKSAAKAAAKTGGKWLSALTGAGAGGLACSWAGPGAVVCAGVAGVATWIAVDAAVIKLDEYFNRDEFEAELAAMVAEMRTDLRNDLVQALNTRSHDLVGPARSFRDQGRTD